MIRKHFVLTELDRLHYLPAFLSSFNSMRTVGSLLGYTTDLINPTLQIFLSGVAADKSRILSLIHSTHIGTETQIVASTCRTACPGSTWAVPTLRNEVLISLPTPFSPLHPSRNYINYASRLVSRTLTGISRALKRT